SPILFHCLVNLTTALNTSSSSSSSSSSFPRSLATSSSPLLSFSPSASDLSSSFTPPSSSFSLFPSEVRKYQSTVRQHRPSRHSSPLPVALLFSSNPKHKSTPPSPPNSSSSHPLSSCSSSSSHLSNSSSSCRSGVSTLPSSSSSMLSSSSPSSSSSSCLSNIRGGKSFFSSSSSPSPSPSSSSSSSLPASPNLLILTQPHKGDPSAVYIHPKAMRDLRIEAGDIVLLSGRRKRETFGIALPEKSLENPRHIQMNSQSMKNIKLHAEDVVKVIPQRFLPHAKRVYVLPFSDSLDQAFHSYFSKKNKPYLHSSERMGDPRPSRGGGEQEEEEEEGVMGKKTHSGRFSREEEQGIRRGDRSSSSSRSSYQRDYEEEEEEEEEEEDFSISDAIEGFFKHSPRPLKVGD
ncbi:cell division protein cdc48ap, partial [Cystoisospora suis]